jgi:hypothetical protein
MGLGSTVTVEPPFVAFDPPLVVAEGLGCPAVLGFVQLGEQPHHCVGQPIELAGDVVGVGLMPAFGGSRSHCVGDGVEAVLGGLCFAVLGGEAFALATDSPLDQLGDFDATPLIS